MNQFTFVATVALDLDRSFERTHLRLTDDESVIAVAHAVFAQCFGRVSPGRVAVIIDSDRFASPLVVPLFVKIEPGTGVGRWRSCPALHSFIRSPSQATYFGLLNWVHSPPGLKFRPCNRGPRLSRLNVDNY